MLKKIILISVLLILAFTGCEKKADEKQVEAVFSGSREVNVVAVRKGDISSYLEFSGKLSAEETVNISPSLSARVRKLLVDEGSVVRQGELLAKLDDTQLLQMQTQFENAEKNYLRMQELQKSGAIDGATFDEMETAYKLAKTNLEFIRENTQILAPMDGVITMIYKKKDENYDAMMDPFFIRMINLSRIKANIQISDADINQIKAGQNVKVSVIGSEDEFSGKVAFISPEADQMSGKFLVEIDVKNKGNQLRNNQFARVKLLTETVRNAVIIPQKAVIKNNLVFIAKNGKAVENLVELGIGNEYEIEVKTGLQENDLVIIAGNIGLKDGDPVEIVK